MPRTIWGTMRKSVPRKIVEGLWTRIAFVYFYVSRKGAIMPHQLFAFYDRKAAFVGMGMVVDAMATLVRCLALAPVLFFYMLRILMSGWVDSEMGKKLIVRPVVFNIFLKDLEEMAGSTVAMFAGEPTGAAVDKLQGWAALQKDLGRLKEQASMNYWKFNKDQHPASGNGGLRVWVAALLQRLWGCWEAAR